MRPFRLSGLFFLHPLLRFLDEAAGLVIEPQVGVIPLDPLEALQRRIVFLGAVIELADIELVLAQALLHLAEILLRHDGELALGKAGHEPLEFLAGLDGLGLVPVDRLHLLVMAHPELEHGIGDIRVRGVKLDKAVVGHLGVDVLLVLEIGVGNAQLRHEGNGIQGVFIPHAAEGLDGLLVVALLVILETPLVDPLRRRAHPGLLPPEVVPPGTAGERGEKEDQDEGRKQASVRHAFSGVLCFQPFRRWPRAK